MPEIPETPAREQGSTRQAVDAPREVERRGGWWWGSDKERGINQSLIHSFIPSFARGIGVPWGPQARRAVVVCRIVVSRAEVDGARGAAADVRTRLFAEVVEPGFALGREVVPAVGAEPLAGVLGEGAVAGVGGVDVAFGARDGLGEDARRAGGAVAVVEGAQQRLVRRAVRRPRLRPILDERAARGHREDAEATVIRAWAAVAKPSRADMDRFGVCVASAADAEQVTTAGICDGHGIAGQANWGAQLAESAARTLLPDIAACSSERRRRRRIVGSVSAGTDDDDDAEVPRAAADTAESSDASTTAEVRAALDDVVAKLAKAARAIRATLERGDSSDETRADLAEAAALASDLRRELDDDDSGTTSTAVASSEDGTHSWDAVAALRRDLTAARHQLLTAATRAAALLAEHGSRRSRAAS
mmetsp:Transcript_4828/g.19705  ORF Transcript_4828/g.19705 Transcript_4828/m.19705 type:complete len:419 (+) Transcript_4828:93-1349(+)